MIREGGALITEDIKNAIKMLKIEDIQVKEISKIGEGAWHSVYKIERNMDEDIVIRIKKKNAYGQLQEYKELDLISEYESSKAYYGLANQCSVNICPPFFEYFLDEKLVFTVESFMGKGLRIHDLNHVEAYTLGKKLGIFFQAMHRKSPAIQGFGNLLWNGECLEGSVQMDIAQIWNSDNNHYIHIMQQLVVAELDFDRNLLVERIMTIIKNRRGNQQSISLVNQDITPENILFDDHNVSLIDPFPRLDFDLKYAGYFVFCYKFLFAAYADAPRYQQFQYNENNEILSKIADGFIDEYIAENKYLYKQIMDEYILWTLLETYDHFDMLKHEKLSCKTMLQMGNKTVINRRLGLCLNRLVTLCKSL